jgi:hypothetical protein
VSAGKNILAFGVLADGLPILAGGSLVLFGAVKRVVRARRPVAEEHVFR